MMVFAISDGAHRELRGRLDIIFEDAGDKMMKNIAEPVHTWLWPAKDASRVNRIMRFDAFSLDLDAHSITVGDEAVHVEPQVYDLIALFCRNPGRLLSHDEIIEKVWRGRFVSDSAVATRINAARKALGDDGTQQKVIRTVRGRGFRFELTPLSDPGGIPPHDRSDRAEVGDRFVLSCTPYGYSLFMAARTDGESKLLYKTLPVYLAESASRHNGINDADNLAVFQNGADAVNCARELLESIQRRCDSLPVAERWTAKIGIGYGTLEHGFTPALAGRMDALSEPGGICITKQALDRLENHNVEVSALTDDDQPDDSSPYRITGIDDWHPAQRQDGRPAQLTNMAIPEPGEVSVIVLPFDLPGENEELAQAAIGLRLEIQNALVQLSGVMPMAAGTASAFAGGTSPDVAKAVGVRYVVQGNIRAIGRQARLMLELYDHHRKGVSWSQRYDGSLDDGFEFQDQMSSRVVRALDVKILSGEQARIWHKSFSDLKAIRLQYSGMRDFFKMTKENMRAARESFGLLHQKHPEVPIGATWTALCHWFEYQRGWCDDPSVAAAETEHWANIAVKMEDADGQAHTALCHVHISRREFDQAERIGAQAVTVRPSCANANGFYAHCLYYCGSVEKAIYHARLAIRYSPAYPPMFAAVLAGALHAKGDQETAIAVAKEGQRINPDDPTIGLILNSALWQAERQDEARLVAVRLLRAHPSMDVKSFVDRMPFREERMGIQLTENGLACLDSLN